MTMPLMKSKSKSAFSHNVGAEMNAGKSQKQSLAIAYSVKRKAKGMAKGGMVESPDKIDPKEHFLSAEEAYDPPFQSEEESDSDLLEANDNEASDAMDNEIGHDDPDQQSKDIVSSILRSIRMKHMGR